MSEKENVVKILNKEFDGYLKKRRELNEQIKDIDDQIGFCLQISVYNPGNYSKEAVRKAKNKLFLLQKEREKTAKELDDLG